MAKKGLPKCFQVLSSFHCACATEPDSAELLEDERLVQSLALHQSDSGHACPAPLDGKEWVVPMLDPVFDSTPRETTDGQVEPLELRCSSRGSDGSAFLAWEVVLENLIPVGSEAGGLKALGASFIQHKGRLVVSDVGEGAVTEYNPGQAIRAIVPGTVVVRVNGKLGTPEDLLAEIDRSSVLRMALSRLRTFEVEICKDAPLGLDCFRRSAVVRAVLPGGLIDTYNENCEPGREVLPGDCVYALNSVVLDPPTFFDKLKEMDGQLVITFHRP